MISATLRSDTQIHFQMHTYSSSTFNWVQLASTRKKYNNLNPTNWIFFCTRGTHIFARVLFEGEQIGDECIQVEGVFYPHNCTKERAGGTSSSFDLRRRDESVNVRTDCERPTFRGGGRAATGLLQLDVPSHSFRRGETKGHAAQVKSEGNTYLGQKGCFLHEPLHLRGGGAVFTHLEVSLAVN